MMRTDRISDVHIHIPEDIDQAYALLCEIRDYGIREMNILALTNDEGFPVDNDLVALYLKRRMTDAQVSVFGGLYYHPLINHYGVPFLQQAQTLLDMGCDGLKFIEEKPNIRRTIGFGLNSKLYDEMFDMLEERQVPIVCHINDPEEYWSREQILKWPIGKRIAELGWLYDNESYLTYDEILSETLERMKRNPRLNIVFAHFMFLSHRLETAREMMETYPNLKLDLTPGWEMFEGFLDRHEEWREFFETYSDRILYGTDVCYFPMKRTIHETVQYAIGGEEREIPIPHATFARMRGFDLSRESQENICHRNYARLIGTPKPVQEGLLLEETRRMLALMRRNDEDANVIARLERIECELSAQRTAQR